MQASTALDLASLSRCSRMTWRAFSLQWERRRVADSTRGDQYLLPAPARQARHSPGFSHIEGSCSSNPARVRATRSSGRESATKIPFQNVTITGDQIVSWRRLRQRRRKRTLARNRPGWVDGQTYVVVRTLPGRLSMMLAILLTGPLHVKFVRYSGGISEKHKNHAKDCCEYMLDAGSALLYSVNPAGVTGMSREPTPE